MMTHDVFVTGATGYLGCALVPRLLERGHRVRGLARPASAHRLPAGCVPVLGDALDHATFADAAAGCDTLVHLIGTPHPSPAKAAEFQSVDLASVREAVAAARAGGVRHVVYVSVAQPAPVMRAYLEARREGEALVRAAAPHATILRPWYVLGPGHRWPLLLRPVYAALALLPATRAGARRLGLVTLDEMVRALVAAVERPATGVRVVDVPGIRAAPHIPPTEDPMSTDRIKTMARRWFDAMNAGDLTAADELFAPDYTLHLPDVPPDARGPEVIKQVIAGYRAAFPDLRFTVEQMVAEGDTVAVRWTVEGTHRGPLMGIAPTGRRARWSGVSTLRLRGDRFVEDRVENDRLGMLQQLGLSIAPAAPAAPAVGSYTSPAEAGR